MFDRFMPEARGVVNEAQAESRELGHSYIDTEHLLLGLLREHRSAAAQTLRSMGFSTELVRARVLEIVGDGKHTAPPGMHAPRTPRATRVLEYSLREALSLGRRQVAPEHILLALTREDEAVAMRILRAGGVSSERLRTALFESMSDHRPVDTQTGRRLGPRVPPIRVDHSPQVLRLFEAARTSAREDGRTQAEIEDLLVALVRDPAAARLLAELGVDEDAVRAAIRREQGRRSSEDPPRASI